MRKRVGRNEPCPCGSGKKYKKCHLLQEAPPYRTQMLPGEPTQQLHPHPLASLFSGPRSQKVSFKGKTVRVLWSRLDVREPTETFHEYIVDVLKRSLGQHWIDEHKHPNESGHVVMRWIYEWHDLAARAMPKGHKPGDGFSFQASGEATALLALADDVYRLQLVHRLPHRILERLRDPQQFQGARYEVAVAAIFARCGFDIEWLDDKGAGKRCEFVARHKASRRAIAVEAKSRHRPGVLNQPGPPQDLAAVAADVDHLFRKALGKDPGGMPFGIFIDLNLPRQPQAGFDKPWVKEMKRVVDSGPPGTQTNPSPYNVLCVTNYSWHYDGQGPAGGSEFLIVVSPHARHPFADPPTLQALQREVETYGHVSPDE